MNRFHSCITVSLIFCSFFTSVNLNANTAKTGMRNLTSMQIVADMGAGWNLGNTLDTEMSVETGWGNPYTTKAMIDNIRYRGFKTLRLPVTWRFHMGGAPNYTIDPAWLDRVEEIANYAFENDMYVIINIHHDDQWIIPTYEKLDGVKNRLSKVWAQIADRFKEYGDYLIFETLNEPRYEGSAQEWSGGTYEGRDCVNQYHKASVDAIRASGGNNARRQIMVSTYAASTVPTAMNELKIPNNDENVIVSIHTYFPYAFCLGGSDATWGTSSDKAALDTELDKVYNKFVANGRAVVMGEWGAGNQNNTADRTIHAEYYARGCVERGMCPVWWDNGNINGSAIFNRNTLNWYFPQIADAIVEQATNSITSGNPIIKHIRSADPSAEVWDDGKVWIYSSHDPDGATEYSTMHDYHVFSSFDMINWTDHGVILSAEDVEWANSSGGFMFAPDAAYKDGTYYLYFPTMDSNWKWRVGVATSTKPEGPFTDVGHFIEGTDHIDPTCFMDDDGQAYLMWGGDKGPPKIARLKENMEELAEEPRIIDYGADNFGEGGYMHKRNGVYYFSYTCNTCSPFQGFYSMADNPYGPFEYKGELNPNPPGAQDHHSMVEFHGQWYYFYHVGNYGAGASLFQRNICVDSLYYNQDGTMKVVVQTKTGVGPDTIGMKPGILIPGRIEAEDYFRHSNIESKQIGENQTVLTQIHTNDWFDFVLEMLGSEEYTADIKVSNAVSGTKIFVLVDEVLQDSVIVGENADTISLPVFLHHGKHTLKLLFNNADTDSNLLDIDWIDLYGETAYFEISASSTSGGSIVPEGLKYYSEGDSAVYTFDKQENYILHELLIDGLSKDLADSYTFYNISENHSIQAIYTACTGVTLHPFYQVNEGEIINAIDLSASETDKVKLWIEFDDSAPLFWLGPQGLSATGKEFHIDSLQFKHAGNYSAFFVDSQGCKSEITFNLDVENLVLDVYEAEDFFSQSGINTQVCTDLGGGYHIGNIENKDWSYYSVNIDTAGFYDIVARVATASEGGTIQLSIRDSIVGTIPVDSLISSGWQDWKTTSPIEIKLSEGVNKMKLTFVGGDGYLFNLNWFDLFFNRVDSVAIDTTDVVSKYNRLTENLYCFTFPNGSIGINYNLAVLSEVSMKIINLAGSEIKTLVSGQQQAAGSYTIDWDGSSDGVGSVSDGLYLLLFSADDRSEVLKIIYRNKR